MKLNEEQSKLVEARPNGHALIKGVAGSGKTTIAIKRMPFLLNNYCYENDDNVLMVTYNKTLVEYMQHLYQKAEKEAVNNYTIFYPHKKEQEITTIDSLIYKYYLERCRKENLRYEVLTDKNKIFKYLHQSIKVIHEKHPDVSMINAKNARFLLEEIDWIKACNYMQLTKYQNADRLGRMSYQSDDETPQKLKKNSSLRKAIFDLVIDYSSRLKKNGYLDFKDIALIALDEVIENKKDGYTHILIDEAQDLTKVQLEVIKRIYKDRKYSSILFLADTAQSIYAHAWLVRGRNFTSIGFDMTGRSSSLTRNYRTTTQIAQSAYSLIENDANIIGNTYFVKPSLINRQSIYPIYTHYRKRNDEIKATITEIKALSLEYKLNEIAIITKFNKDIKYLEKELKKANLASARISNENADFTSNSIKLLTMHSIKGLEFKVVFIIAINQGILPQLNNMDEEEKVIQESNQRRLFYVGMTRARELLYLSSHGITSPFINDINPNYLQLSRNSLIKKYSKKRLEDYYFLDKINPYSAKENIRQWMIDQLLNEYNYQIDYIDIDYSIKEQSVDLVIKNEDKKCHAFGLVNPYGTGIEDLMIKIKNIMGTENDIQYAFATDGNQVLFVKNGFELIEDLPRF